MLTRVIGEIDWSDVAASQSWQTVTRLDGVEVLTTGAIEIEAEESSARVATISVVGPPTAEVDSTLDVDLVVGDHVEPLFRGRVTEPQFDPARRVTTYEATDQIQRRIDSLTREQIEGLTPEATTENGNDDQGWRYLRHRLESWPGSFDTTRDGFFRATRWDGADLMPNAITAAIDRSERLSLVRADQVRNRVKLEARLSWIRLAIREHTNTWVAPYSLCDFLTGRRLGYQVSLPMTETVTDAISSAGWDIESINLQPLMNGDAEFVDCRLRDSSSQRIVIVGEIDAIRQARWTLTKRYSRTLQAALGVTLDVASSVSRFGLRDSTQSVSYRDPADDSSFLRPDAGGETQPLLGTGASPTATSDGFDLSGTDPKGDRFVDQLDGGAAEDIVTDAINRAMTQIASAHRGTTLSVQTLVRPDIERHHRVEMQLPFVTSQGKVSRVRHVLDTEAGSATTDVEIRIFQGGDGQPVSADWSGLGDMGLSNVKTRADDPTPLPDPGTYVGGLDDSPPESEDWHGWIYNANTDTGWWADSSTFDPNPPSNETYSTGFAVRTPPIEMPDQETADVEDNRTIAVHLPEDPLVYA